MMRVARSSAPFPADAASLARSLYGRVPLQHRPHLWLSLTGARDMMRASQLTYWQITQMADAMGEQLSDAVRQIDLDLPRTFTGHASFAATPSGAPSGVRVALRRVLVAYAAYNSSVGYCQSLNFIAALFLLVADEEGAFWLLAALCGSVVPDYRAQSPRVPSDAYAYASRGPRTRSPALDCRPQSQSYESRLPDRHRPTPSPCAPS
jgi:hypothetical protein